MNLEQIKALGAPFRAMEVRVSLRAKVATLVIVAPGRGNPSMDFHLTDDYGDAMEVCHSITSAAIMNGLINDNSIVAFVDADAQEAN